MTGLQQVVPEIFDFKHQGKDDVTDAQHKIRLPPLSLNGHNSATNHVTALKFWIFS